MLLGNLQQRVCRRHGQANHQKDGEHEKDNAKDELKGAEEPSQDAAKAIVQLVRTPRGLPNDALLVLQLLQPAAVACVDAAVALALGLAADGLLLLAVEFELLVDIAALATAVARADHVQRQRDHAPRRVEYKVKHANRCQRANGKGNGVVAAVRRQSVLSILCSALGVLARISPVFLQ